MFQKQQSTVTLLLHGKSIVQHKKHYIVEKIVEMISMPDSCSCKIRCATCNACVHAYSCTCMDYLVHATVCKLIHAVHMIYSEISAYQGHDNTSTIENSSGNDQASSGIFTEESSTSISADTETISSLQCLTQQVSNHSTSDDILAMREGNQYV